MSPVSERVLGASPPVWEDREARSLALAALACLQAGQSGVSPRLDQRVAPSLAMSTYAAEERDSQPAQRDELAHSCIVPTRGEVSPPTNVTSPTAITENTGSQHRRAISLGRPLLGRPYLTPEPNVNAVGNPTLYPGSR